MATSTDHVIVSNQNSNDDCHSSGAVQTKTPSTVTSTPTETPFIHEQRPWLQNWLDSVVTRTLCQFSDSERISLPTVRQFLPRIGLSTRIACALHYYSKKSSSVDSDSKFTVCLEHYLPALRGEPLSSVEDLLEDDHRNAVNVSDLLNTHLPELSDAGLLRTHFSELAQQPTHPSTRLTNEQELSLLVEFYQWVCQSSLSQRCVIPLQATQSKVTETTAVAGPGGLSCTEDDVLQNLVKTSAIAVRPARPVHPNNRPLALLNTLVVDPLVTTNQEAATKPMDAETSNDHQPVVSSSDNDLLSNLVHFATQSSGANGDSGFFAVKSEPTDKMPSDSSISQTGDALFERNKLYATFRKNPSPIVSNQLPVIGTPRSSKSNTNKTVSKSINVPVTRKDPIPSLRSEFEQRKQARSTNAATSQAGSKRSIPSGTTTWASSSGPKRTSSSSQSSRPARETDVTTLPRSTATALRLSLDQRRRAIEASRQRALAATDKAVAERHHAAFQNFLQAEHLRHSQHSETALASTCDDKLVTQSADNEELASEKSATESHSEPLPKPAADVTQPLPDNSVSSTHLKPTITPQGSPPSSTVPDEYLNDQHEEQQQHSSSDSNHMPERLSPPKLECHHCCHSERKRSRSPSFHCTRPTHSPVLSHSPCRPQRSRHHPRVLTSCSLTPKQQRQQQPCLVRKSCGNHWMREASRVAYNSRCPCERQPEELESYYDYPEGDFEEEEDGSYDSGSDVHSRSNCVHEHVAVDECFENHGHYRNSKHHHHHTHPRQLRHVRPSVIDRFEPEHLYQVQSEFEDMTIASTTQSIDCATLPSTHRFPVSRHRSNASLTGRATWNDRPKLRDLSAGASREDGLADSRQSPNSEPKDEAPTEPFVLRSPEYSLFGDLEVRATAAHSKTPSDSEKAKSKAEPKQFFIAFEEPDPQRMQRKCDQLEARRAAERAALAAHLQARRDREREEKQSSELLEKERRLMELEKKTKQVSDGPIASELYPVRSAATVLSRSEANLSSGRTRLANRPTPKLSSASQRNSDVRSSIQRLRTKSTNKLRHSVVGLRGSGDGEASTKDNHHEEEDGTPLSKARNAKSYQSLRLTNSKATATAGLSLSSLHRFGNTENQNSNSSPTTNQPKLYVMPKAKSNRMVIMNAISHACLAGAVNEPMKQTTLRELAATEGTHFMILFRDSRCQYRAVYAFDLELEELRLICGTGPRRITHEMANRFYKYNSGGKHFTEITSTNHLSPVVDAITIHDSLWSKSNSQSAAAALSLVSTGRP